MVLTRDPFLFHWFFLQLLLKEMLPFVLCLFYPAIPIEKSLFYSKVGCLGKKKTNQVVQASDHIQIKDK